METGQKRQDALPQIHRPASKTSQWLYAVQTQFGLLGSVNELGVVQDKFLKRPKLYHGYCKCCDVYLTLRVGGIKDFLGVDRLRSCGVKKWILLKKGLSTS